MQTITTIGFDIAKSAFQVRGVNASGRVVIRRQLKRRSVLAFFQKLPPVPGRYRGLRLVPVPLSSRRMSGAILFTPQARRDSCIVHP
jgi:transposase